MLQTTTLKNVFTNCSFFFVYFAILQHVLSERLLNSSVFAGRNIVAVLDSLLVDQKETRGEKEKGIEGKKFALVAKVFCGHAYATDLVGLFGLIRGANELGRRKSCCGHISSTN